MQGFNSLKTRISGKLALLWRNKKNIEEKLDFLAFFIIKRA
jgi:hypothetical protein